MEAKKSNAGRKPIADKKVTFYIFIKQSIIDKLTKEAIQEICYKAIEKKLDYEN